MKAENCCFCLETVNHSAATNSETEMTLCNKCVHNIVLGVVKSMMNLAHEHHDEADKSLDMAGEV
jgi:hypothetical protein